MVSIENKKCDLKKPHKIRIKKENTIAIGDSSNDLEMLDFAGISVAMGNSQEHILQMADYVTDTAENSGVAKAIEKFLL